MDETKCPNCGHELFHESTDLSDLPTAWRDLAMEIRKGAMTPESDAYVSALEACAVSLQNAVDRATEEKK